MAFHDLLRQVRILHACRFEAGRYEGMDSLYCRYAFSFGEDWQVARGVEEGLSQVSTAGGSAYEEGGALAVWNFPVDVTFRSTDVFGWPQLVISVYGTDAFGRSDMIIGYGAAHLPMSPGRHELYVRTFRPLAASTFGRLLSWVLGSRPEFRDSMHPSRGDERAVTRTQSFGCVKVILDVTLQGMEELGYQLAPAPRPAQAVHQGFGGVPLA